jgi:hypothetical protein
MTPNEKINYIFAVMRAFAKKADVAAVRAFRASVDIRRLSVGLALQVSEKGLMLAMIDRIGDDGDCDDGYLPLIWVQNGSREVLGMAKVNDVLSQLDAMIELKGTPAN